jgi:hypothetical protein
MILVRRIGFCCTLLVSGAACFAQTPAAEGTITVPFVGCRSDGQVGPLAAPSDAPKKIRIAAAAAQRLAWYQAKDGIAVLAPRGWHCFSTYGSSGSSLFVTPGPIDGASVLSPNWKGITGDAIEVTLAYGGTSGRFQVAKVIARVFPKHHDFVDDVLAEGIQSAADFPEGPYPNDKLTYRGEETVEYVTPGNTKGLGTDSYLLPSAEPIVGVDRLVDEELDLVQLSARVPAGDADLIGTIQAQVEKESISALSH